MDCASIQVALSGKRPMTHDELTSGFYQLLWRVEQEEAYTSHMREVMIFNGDLVDTCAERCNANYVNPQLVPQKIAEVEAEL